MKIVLSSRWTPFFKFVFPVVWGGLLGYITSVLFLNSSSLAWRLLIWRGHSDPPSVLKWISLGALFLGGLVCARLVRLKRVVLDEDSVLISNYFRMARVPFQRIRAGGIDPDAEIEVSGSAGPVAVHDRRPLVVLEFSGRTPFGRSIEFIPRSQEVLAELRKRLGWKEPPVEPPPEERSELADELRGRGTV